MSKVASKTAPAVPQSAEQVKKLNVGLLLLDTTWRIAVPVVMFAGLGLIADLKFKAVPWLTIAGMIIGFGFAIILVKQLLVATEDKA